MVPMKRILITNDDGVYSEGIRALADALAPLGEVIIVAPTEEASAIGHALTLKRPLRLEMLAPGMYAVDGTPTDCVNLAITKVFKGLPDFVASGINKGWNIGDDITYSGTVAGALEGALLGVPGMAVSLRHSRDNVYDFTHAARAAASVERVGPRARAACADVSERQRAQKRTAREPSDRPGHAQSRDVGGRAARSQGTAVLLDRRRAERVGSGRTLRLPGGAGRICVDHAASARPDRACGAGAPCGPNAHGGR